MTVAGNAATIAAPQLRGRRSRGSSGNDFRLTLKSLIPAGTWVKKGDLVAEFDRQFMELRLDDLTADVRDRELTLETVRANLKVNRKAYDQRILAAEGAVQKATLDLRTAPVRSAIVTEKFRLNLEEARAHLKQLRAESGYFDISETAALRQQELELRGEQIDLQRAQRNSDRMRIVAPIDGVFVPQRIRRGGEFTEIKAGDDLASGAVVGQIHDTSRLIVEAAVNQADIHALRAGAAASLKAEAFPDLNLPARLRRIGSIAQGGGSRRDYVRAVPVQLSVEGSDPRLMPNFTVAADIVIGSEPDRILLPREAVTVAPEGERVFVRSPQGWTERAVTTAASNHIQVAVESGVAEGDVVALEPPPAGR